MNKKIHRSLSKWIEQAYEQDVSQDAEFNAFVEKLDDRILHTYFGWDQTKGDGGYWTQQTSYEHRWTGKRLVEEIQAIDPDSKLTILDVGCGRNEFKERLGDRVTGIDPYNALADIPVSIEDYNPVEQSDWVFALGSINFGDEQTIYNQVERVVGFCKPGGTIIIRANPGITHDHGKAKWIDFFNWTEELINKFATDSGCTVVETGWDHPSTDTVRWGNRYYTQWRKND
jgi:SAM-dependent methyltransferase